MIIGRQKRTILMNIESELIAQESGAFELNPAQVRAQQKMISELMGSVLKEDTHYGLIPGCGNKPAIFLPGAHKLGMMFNLGPRYNIERNELGSDHREYEITCELVHRGTGRFIGEGVGVCSTMESKYRFRNENTGEIVPKEYWDTRDNEIIGGPSFAPKKIDGKWLIQHKVEHDNPADYYNTVKKIAKKRAYNDAILTCTAASDIFVPDDDTDDQIMSQESQEQGPRTVTQPQSRSGQPASTDATSGTPVISEGQCKLIYARLKNADIGIESFYSKYGISEIDQLPRDFINDCLEWIDGETK